MARERTKDEILDQAVFAVAAVARHYGPGFSAEGLQELRILLAKMPWNCDSTWRVDTLEGDGEPDPDFCPAVLTEVNAGLEFKDTAIKSRTGQEDNPT